MCAYYCFVLTSAGITLSLTSEQAPAVFGERGAIIACLPGCCQKNPRVCLPPHASIPNKKGPRKGAVRVAR
jgi:hypothetical protein